MVYCTQACRNFKMNCFLVCLVMSYFVFSFGEELAILPSLKQYWVIKGSTLNLTCIHNGTQTSQEHTLSFWKSNTQFITGSGVTVYISAFPDAQDITRTTRNLTIHKLDVQFSDGGQYKCALGQNISNFKGEAVIEVRVLEFQSEEYYMPDIPPEKYKLIIHCDASGVNPTDTNYTFTTYWLKVSEGKEQVLGNSSKYTIFTVNRTLEIAKPLREDAGEYRCVFVFNMKDKASYQEVRSGPFYVKAVPKIETHDKDKNMILGEKLELRCTASGFPKPIINWMKDGKPLNRTERVNLKEDQIVIYCLQFDDEGDYQCVASHPEFGVTNSVTIHITVKGIADARSGGRGYMQCCLWPYLLFLLGLLQYMQYGLMLKFEKEAVHLICV